MREGRDGASSPHERLSEAGRAGERGHRPGDGAADEGGGGLTRPEDLLVSEATLRRRSAAARARRRRLWLMDAAIALAIVLVLLIAGVGIGLLGLIALLILIGFGVALGGRALWRGRRRRSGQ